MAAGNQRLKRASSTAKTSQKKTSVSKKPLASQEAKGKPSHLPTVDDDLPVYLL